jgi:hypothetical protein
MAPSIPAILARDSGLGPGRHTIQRQRFRENRVAACRQAGQDRHGLPFKKQYAAVRKGHCREKEDIISQELCWEIIRSVNAKIILPDNIHDVVGGATNPVCLGQYIRVDGPNFSAAESTFPVSKSLVNE